VLQRLAEGAERLHALLDRGIPEHLPPQLQSSLVKVAGVHPDLPLKKKCGRAHEACLLPAPAVRHLSKISERRQQMVLLGSGPFPHARAMWSVAACDAIRERAA
jgi:hypothetical protein